VQQGAAVFFSVLFFGLGCAGAAEPNAAGHLVMAQFPAGWVQDLVRPGADQDLVEYVPEGQAGGKWQSKISIETYRRLNLPLDALQRRAAAQARDGCDGIVEGKFQSGLTNGYGSAFWTLGCKRDKRTGYGETRYTKAIQSSDTLYVINRIWRTKAFGDGGPDIPPRATQDAVAFLANAVVCEPGSTLHPCPAAATELPGR
jgi:hypothetical protein